MAKDASTDRFFLAWKAGNAQIKREHPHDVMLMLSMVCGIPRVSPFKGRTVSDCRWSDHLDSPPVATMGRAGRDKINFQNVRGQLVTCHTHTLLAQGNCCHVYTFSQV